MAASIGYVVLFGTLIIVLSIPALFIAQAKLFRTYVRRDADATPGNSDVAKKVDPDDRPESGLHPHETMSCNLV